VVERLEFVGWTNPWGAKGRTEQEKEEEEEMSADSDAEAQNEMKGVAKGEIKEGLEEKVEEEDEEEEEETPSPVWDDAYDARLRTNMMPWLLFLLVLYVVKYACGLW